MQDPLGRVPIKYKLLLTFGVTHLLVLLVGIWMEDHLWAGAIIAAAVLVILIFPIRFVIRPLVRMREAAEAIERGDLDISVAVESEDEIGVLARAMNRMADRLAKRTEALERRERELSEERRLLQSIIDHMQAGVLFLDERCEVVLSNDATAPVRRARETGSPGPRVCHLASEATRTRDVVRSPDREEDGRWYEDVLVPLVGDGPELRGVIWVSRDVTERREMEARAALAEKLGAVGRLAAGVAHELSTPLGSIVLYADELVNLVRDGDAALADGDVLRTYASTVQDEAYRCREIVRTLLDFSRRPAEEAEAVDVGALVREAVGLVRHGLNGDPVELRGPGEDGAEEPVRVQGDPTLLRGAILNVVANAVDAVREVGGGEVDVRVERTSPDRVVVEVADEGPGIPADDLDRVWEPFYTTKPPGKGTGLGLAIVERDVRWMGGEVSIESREGEGTRVRIELAEAEEGEEGTDHGG